MNSQGLLEYVRRVKDLEVGIYENELLEKKFEEKRQKGKPVEPEEPEYIDETEPQKPVLEEDKSDSSDIIEVGLGLLFGLLGMLRMANEHMFGGIVLLAIGGWICFAVFNRHSKVDERNKRKLEDYKQSVNHYKALGDIPAWNQQKKKTYEMCLELYTERRERYEKCCNDIPPLVRNVRVALSGALEKLYAENIIYPKYRNMVAVTTIYEYLESGRCNRLEGPDGAYNLYEMELRQNIIIGQLSVIASNLERIKENQFMLYNEIVEANYHANYVLSNIRDDVMLNAYQNKAINENLETIKFLETMQYLQRR